MEQNSKGGVKMRYIALLRGVNVGGKNKLSMAELKESFKARSFSDVTTYINSGNILFSSDRDDVEQLKSHVEELILADFSLEIPVTLISGEELVESLSYAPDWWNNDPDSKHNTIIVIPPATPAEIAEQIGEIKPEYEKISMHGQFIFWSAPLKTFSRSRWSRIVKTSAYQSITIRNANTTLKLAELVQK